MKSDLTSKIPLRQHAKNILKITKYVKTMEKGYFAVVCGYHICEVGQRYLALILSATVLNMISAGEQIKKITESKLCYFFNPIYQNQLLHFF